MPTLKPMHVNVLIKKEGLGDVDEATGAVISGETESGIALVDTAATGTRKHKQRTGIVHAVGDGRHVTKKVCPKCGSDIERLGEDPKNDAEIVPTDSKICVRARQMKGCDWVDSLSEAKDETFRIPPEVKVGDRVLVDRWQGHPVVINDEEFFVVNGETDIAAVLDEDVQIE